MQSMVTKQNGSRAISRAAIAGKLICFNQSGAVTAGKNAVQLPVVNLVCGYLVMPAFFEWYRLVKEVGHISHHAGAAHRVVLVPFCRPAVFGKDIGPVQGIIERSPAGICGIQGITGIVHRNNKLGPGGRGDLCINVCSCDFKVSSLVNQVADLAKEILVSTDVVGLSAPLDMPGIDLALQIPSGFQQLAIHRGKIPNDVSEGRPKGVDFYPGTRNEVIIDCFVE